MQHTLATGDKIFVYSNADQIILQLRRFTSTEEQILEPSFKVAVSLEPEEAIALASDLLHAALPQLAALRSSPEVKGTEEEMVIKFSSPFELERHIST